MQPLASIHHKPPAIHNALTVSVAAEAGTTRRALYELDLTDTAIRATRALGLTDRINLTHGGLIWSTDRGSRHITVAIDARVEPDGDDGSSLTITTRFTATDGPTYERLLDAWPLVNPLARELIQRAARTVKEYAEADRVEAVRASNEPVGAAA